MIIDENQISSAHNIKIQPNLNQTKQTVPHNNREKKLFLNDYCINYLISQHMLW